jgi:hypothetical protein
MKVIIAGGRDYDDYPTLKARMDRLNNLSPITCVICGEARGADSLGKRWAIESGREVISMPADWNKYGKSAGYRRNEEMAKIADGLVAFWDGKSRGTSHMIDLAKKYKLKMIAVFDYSEDVDEVTYYRDDLEEYRMADDPVLDRTNYDDFDESLLPEE